MRIRQGFWGIETAGWSVDQAPECITLCPADTEAALQISCHRKRVGEVSLEELSTFAREHLPDAVPLSVTGCGDFEAVYGEFTSEGVYWRNWWMGHDGTHLFVSYIGSSRAALREGVECPDVSLPPAA
jgi:hypothetical protein